MGKKHCRTHLLIWSILLNSVAFAQPPINGTAEPEFYGPPLVIQNIQTGFGDSTFGQIGFGNGSELDGSYGYVSGGALYLVLAGNLQSDFTKLNLFFDTKAGGQNRLRSDNLFDANNPRSWYLTRLGGPTNGFTFDVNFAPDYFLGLYGAADHISFSSTIAKRPRTRVFSVISSAKRLP